MDIDDLLRALEQEHQAGALTDEEFERARREAEARRPQQPPRLAPHPDPMDDTFQRALREALARARAGSQEPACLPTDPAGKVEFPYGRRAGVLIVAIVFLAALSAVGAVGALSPGARALLARVVPLPAAAGGWWLGAGSVVLAACAVALCFLLYRRMRSRARLVFLHHGVLLPYSRGDGTLLVPFGEVRGLEPIGKKDDPTTARGVMIKTADGRHTILRAMLQAPNPDDAFLKVRQLLEEGCRRSAAPPPIT